MAHYTLFLKDFIRPISLLARSARPSPAAPQLAATGPTERLAAGKRPLLPRNMHAGNANCVGRLYISANPTRSAESQARVAARPSLLRACH